MNKPILHLNLKRCWFDMIKSGEKTIEYRSYGAYWARQLLLKCGKIKIKNKLYLCREIVICFSNGYAKNRDQFYCDIKKIRLGKGYERWGAIPGKIYFIIWLGKPRHEQ